MSCADYDVKWLTEAVLLGSSEVRLTELNLAEDTSTLLELALGSSREPACTLWHKMMDYAFSRGTMGLDVKVLKCFKSCKSINTEVLRYK